MHANGQRLWWLLPALGIEESLLRETFGATKRQVKLLCAKATSIVRTVDPSIVRSPEKSSCALSDRRITTRMRKAEEANDR